MTFGICEPILAGIGISLINKYIIHNDCLYNCLSNYIKHIKFNKRNEIKKNNSSSSSELENNDYLRKTSAESYTTSIVSDISNHNNHLIHIH